MDYVVEVVAAEVSLGTGLVHPALVRVLVHLVNGEAVTIMLAVRNSKKKTKESFL